MNVLAIDTSTFVMGVAVIRDNSLAGEMITQLKKNHSIRLMPAIRTLMEEVEMKTEELDRIVVAEGPGSYTGVRIGVTTAKTLAWSLGIPITGVSSLEVMAQHGRYFNGVISPFIDARRGQVYTGLYRYENGKIKCLEEDRIVLHEDWLKTLKSQKEKVLFTSSDMAKHTDEINSILGEQAVFATVTEEVSRPGELAVLGMEKEAEPNAHSFTPNYIRLAEAEANWQAANSGEQTKNKGE